MRCDGSECLRDVLTLDNVDCHVLRERRRWGNARMLFLAQLEPANRNDARRPADLWPMRVVVPVVELGFTRGVARVREDQHNGVGHDSSRPVVVRVAPPRLAAATRRSELRQPSHPGYVAKPTGRSTEQCGQLRPKKLCQSDG